MAFSLEDLEIEEVSLVDAPANPHAKMCIHKRDDSLDKAEWTNAFINDLPDSSFAWIDSGGKKDESGKTVPRSLRKLPYRDASGKVDLPHLRNALSRLSQSDIPRDEQNKIREKLRAALADATNKSQAATPPVKEGNMPDTKIEELAAKVSELEKAAEESNKILEDVNKQLAAVIAERDELKKRVDAFDNTPEAVEKRKLEALPEDIRKRLEASEARIQKMEDEKLSQVFVAKAQALGQNDEFGSILKRMHTHDSTPEDIAEIERIIKAQTEQIKTGKLFTTIGRDGNDGDVSDAPEQQIMAKAHALKKEKNIDFQDALAEVARDNPELYEAYRHGASVKS